MPPTAQRFVVTALLALICATTVAQELLPEGLPEAEYPEALRFPAPGVLSDVPAQDAFRGWPPAELRRQPYWLPWSDLSFNRARLFQRPVLFVMVTGWSLPAQKMLRGTLATGTVLAQTNQGYISLLVNADRRPDIKERYQTGVLPVIAFLLPNGQPMLSQANDLGKAQPITAGDVDVRGMLFLLVEGDKYWKKWPELLMQVGAEWTRREAENDATPGVPDELASDTVEAWLLGNADRSDGGFGAAPKFIISGLSEYSALRAARLRGALERHAVLTIDKLVASPLYDSGGGGIYRLAAAPQWGDIAAEKLLTTNTTLVQQLTLRLRLGGDATIRKPLAETAGFITGTLGRPGGGYYQAESPPLGSSPGVSIPDSETHIDRLVLAGPNALAGAALLRAGATLGDSAIFDSGRSAIALVLQRSVLTGRGAAHVIEPGPNDRIFLTAHADVALGLVDAYESLGDPQLLDAAAQVAEFAIRNLRHEDEDPLRDGITQIGALGLLANPRRPLVGNVRLARALIRIAHQRRDTSYRDEAERLLGAFAGDLAAYRVHGVEAALAIEEYVRDPVIVTIHGSPDGPRTSEMRRAAVSAAWPWSLTRTGDPSGRGRAEVSFGGTTEMITSPEEINATIRKLTGAAQP